MDRRKLFWLLFLAAAAVIAVIPAWFDTGSDGVVVPVVQRHSDPPALHGSDASQTQPGSPLQLGLLPGERGTELHANLFAPHTWREAAPAPTPASAPAPRPPPRAAPAPPPAAPPLPFEYFGKLEHGGKVLVFLRRGSQVYSVSEGDVIDGVYGVRSIGGTEMVFVYLPLNLSQALAVGSNL